MEFNVYLRRLRIENQLTMSQLAMDSGVSQGHLSLIETGKRGVPKPDVLKKLSAPLNVPLLDLMHAAGYIEPVNQESTQDSYEIKNLTKEEKEYLEMQLEIFRKFKESKTGKGK